ncbi:tyrosine recombinase [Escherichia coli]|nr:tyrosine recombinase [Escherichia coli]
MRMSLRYGSSFNTGIANNAIGLLARKPTPTARNKYSVGPVSAFPRLIQDYLGHRNIRHTVRYTASNAARFAGLWERNNLINEKLKREEV